MIQIEGLHKSFNKNHVLKGINLQFKAGSVVALMGPNGSGKTTLLKSLLGLIMPQKGEIYIKGEKVKNPIHFLHFIGYMPQIARFPENLKVKELIEMIKDIRDRKKDLDEELFESLKIHSLFPKALGTLSGGQKQRVGAYLAFLFKPEIIILDEPTAGLDPVSSEIIKDKITREKKNGRLILITTHILTEAEDIADRLVYIMDGKTFIDNTLSQLKEETGEIHLGKALAKKIQEDGGK